MKAFLQNTARTALAVTLILAATPALAWTGPTSAPPGGNVSTPLNIGGTGQTKTGYLGLGGAAPSYPLTITGPSANWAEAINWPPSSAPGYGILVGTYASGYSQFQNNSGYYTQLAIGANGVVTNGGISAASIAASGNISGANLYAGSSFLAGNGDMYMGYSGQYLSTVLGWNGSTYGVLATTPANHKDGGGYGWASSGGYCYEANNFTGGCSCPAFAPYAYAIQSENDRTGTWYSSYLCVSP